MRPYTELAKAVGGLGDALQEASVPFEASEGAKAVTKDENGNIQVAWRAEFTRGDKAYNAAARQGALASARTGISQQLLELRNQHDGDPVAFQKAAEAFVKQVGAGGDKMLRPFLQNEAASQTAQYYEGLLQSKHNSDLKRSLQSLDAREGLLSDELESLAAQGGVTTPEFQRKRAELDDIRAQKAVESEVHLHAGSEEGR